MLTLYTPQYQDLWFRQKLLADPETMSYNHAWGGVIDFSPRRWSRWYQTWLCDTEGNRFYRYLVDESRSFVGEIAYRREEAEDIYMASIIVLSAYRGKGYGRIGLKLLCDAAKSNGLSALYDDIAVDNSAIGLFSECGFTEEYRTKEIVMLKKQL